MSSDNVKELKMTLKALSLMKNKFIFEKEFPDPIQTACLNRDLKLEYMLKNNGFDKNSYLLFRQQIKQPSMKKFPGFEKKVTRPEIERNNDLKPHCMAIPISLPQSEIDELPEIKQSYSKPDFKIKKSRNKNNKVYKSHDVFPMKK